MNIVAFGFGGPEMIVVLVLGLLIFGRRLPSVARSIGSSYTQFRAGLRDDIDKAATEPHENKDNSCDCATHGVPEKEYHYPQQDEHALTGEWIRGLPPRSLSTQYHGLDGEDHRGDKHSRRPRARQRDGSSRLC